MRSKWLHATLLATTVGACGAPSPGGSGGSGGASGSGAGGSGGFSGADNEPAPADVSKWANPGSLASKVVNNSGPDGLFTLFVPEPLGAGGSRHPILTWGNGVGTTPEAYAALLSHYASHGIFVVATNSTWPGTGVEMIAGLNWAFAESSREGSPYFGKLDTAAVACLGYSQGGIGSAICGHEAAVKTTLIIAGGHPNIGTITNPIFLIGNERDEFVVPGVLLQPQYDIVTEAPIVYGVSLGTGHLTTLGNGGVHRGYTTAWLAYHLRGEQSARRVFFGNDQCTLCGDPSWSVKRKNLE
jgi:hypothetical protein